ncbi:MULTISPECIES: hypothetical protein [unclassified Streptomyces]
MRTMWKRAGIAALLTAVMTGIVTPAASAAPMPWETSTVTPLCGNPCYQ